MLVVDNDIMPHRNANGKIVTSKTPIISNHSIKISSTSTNADSLKVSTKIMKSKQTSAAAEQISVTWVKNGAEPVAAELLGAESNGHSNNLINKNSLNVQKLEENGVATVDKQLSEVVMDKEAVEESVNANGVMNGHGGDENSTALAPLVHNPLLKNGFLHFHPSIKDLCDVPCRKDFIKTLDSEMSRPKKIYRVVLTGGPCGGKTTGQARLCTFFENLGWKVFRVPEAATVLLGGGIKFSELSEDEAFRFQEELLRTMMQIESVFFRMAEAIDKDVLIICDRGTMDASAFIKRSYWEDILARNNLNEVDIRDTRYNQIIHMVSAANGAEPFYTTEDHICRTEGIALARELDKKAAQAWVGHPYFDVVDNSSDFESKVCRMIQVIIERTHLSFTCGEEVVDRELRKIFGDQVVSTAQSSSHSTFVSRSSSSSSGCFSTCDLLSQSANSSVSSSALSLLDDSNIGTDNDDNYELISTMKNAQLNTLCVCQKLGIDAKDRLETNAKKVKFLVKGPLPDKKHFPSGFQDFTVVHDYLQTNGPKVQARLRKRGQLNHFSYTYTVRRPELQGQVVEVKTTLTQRDYNNMLAQRDPHHVTVFKDRRCFLLNNQYFQLDVYKDPCHERCKGLILLETYSTLRGSEVYQRLPSFLDIVQEVTGDPRYSMFNLSLKDRWVDNKYFCQSLTGGVSDQNGGEYTKSELKLACC
ncbi:hypothetical protein Ocin01_07814 [Orchesella cincta]|uniref:NadR/Ttd14 AAA domain-containing protein n=1 Tax=Orchesella cincta TaxID=48709 RepID=A0A1D2N0P2_ORCCI|nr:hypothetical protein Ocin01_07814 [Orchesella cincta]